MLGIAGSLWTVGAAETANPTTTPTNPSATVAAPVLPAPLTTDSSKPVTTHKQANKIPAALPPVGTPNDGYNSDDYTGYRLKHPDGVQSHRANEHLWNLQDMDIKRVVAEVSKETGKNFILDPQVQGKITIISSHPMGPEESYQVFLSSLRVLGYAVVPDGDNLKIVPSRDSANQATLASHANPGSGDQAVVRVIPVRYLSAIELMPALRPLLPSWGNLGVYAPANSVIVSGSADNVDRIAKIIATVDTPSANSMDLVQLQHSVASDVVDEVNKLIMAARANGANINATLSADPQSNSILVGGDATARLRLKVLLAKLDSQSGDANNNTQVIYLRYIQIKDILPILKGMVHQSVSYAMSSGGASYGAPPSPMGGGVGGDTGSSLSQASPQFLAAANSQLSNAAINSSMGGMPNDKSRVTIVGDITNNALIITADPTTMMQFKSVISHLDVAPQEVLVQGVIAEVDANTAKQLGIEWGTPNSVTTPGGYNADIPAGGPSNFSSNGVGLGVGVFKLGNLRALLTMLAEDTNTNIVSTPSITVLNNTPADIEVGKTIYQLSGGYQVPTGGGQGGLYNSYTPQQIGLTLKVIPQITGDNQVRLVIDQQNSQEADTATVQGGSNTNIPTSIERISTQVMVQDGQILVLGGLISAQDRTVVDKVPILGDIPLLGYLFQSHHIKHEKQNLMVFLQPIVINTPAQYKKLTTDRYDYMRDVAILNDQGDGQLIASSILPSRTAAANDALPTPFSDDSQ
jgi:general secretion pathway protein D